jgi:hypothetical protein
MKEQPGQVTAIADCWARSDKSLSTCCSSGYVNRWFAECKVRVFYLFGQRRRSPSNVPQSTFALKRSCWRFKAPTTSINGRGRRRVPQYPQADPSFELSGGSALGNSERVAKGLKGGRNCDWDGKYPLRRAFDLVKLSIFCRLTVKSP